MARNEQLVRQHKILQLLENSRLGKTLEELRDDLVDYLGLASLHTRTVHRDLEALQAAGFDVSDSAVARGSVWKLGPNFRGSHKITASATELIALSLSRDLLLPLVGTPFWTGLEAFWHKLRETLPGAVWEHYEKYRQTLRVHGMPAKSYEKFRGLLSAIHRCIEEHRVMEIEYQAVGRKSPRTRRIEPYGVVLYQSSLYIIAHSGEGDASEGEDRSEILHLKLDRFRKGEALDVWFKPDASFDLSSHLRQSLGIFSRGSEGLRDFRIRISAFAAPWVHEDPWHADQHLEPQSDGGVILTVKAAHELDVVPRVLALGAEAEVLSPASCRKTVARIAQQLAAKYSGGE